MMDLYEDVQVQGTVQTVPNSRECEEAVIGAVLINPELYQEIDLEPADLYFDRNRWIWETFADLHAAHKPIDFLTVQERLNERGKLAQIGGAAYLTSLTNAVPFTYNADEYAETIRDRAHRRHLIDQATALAKAAMDLGVNLENEIARVATSIVSEAGSGQGAVHISHFASEVYDEVDAMSRAPNEVYGIPTGLVDYDRITHGLMPGEITLITGESGLGKTMFIGDLACGAADHAPGAFYEMEMKGRAVVRRLMSGEAYRNNKETCLTVNNMRSGQIPEDDWPMFTHVFEKIAQKEIYMSDRSDWTTTSIRADLARLKARYNIQWFIVDYMDLLRDNIYRDYHLNSAAISRNLHAICTDLDLAGLIIHTENKQQELSGSAKVKYDADQIIKLIPGKSPNTIEAIWKKFREGDRPNRWMELRRAPGFPTLQPIAQARTDAPPAMTAPLPKPKIDPIDLEPDWDSNEDLDL